MNIKFSHKYYKLHNFDCLSKKLQLLDVVNIKLEDMSKEFLDYDTEKGTFPLPKKGDYMMLIFLKDNVYQGTNLMTTLRRRTPEKEKYYRENIGQWFDVQLQVQS